MLHITNGDSTTAILRQSGIDGETFSFRDALIFGPTPANVQAQEWHTTRALHLADSYGVDFKTCVESLVEQERVLEKSTAHDEIVLWFEHDLFCQVNLIYLLNRFRGVPLKNTRLSLINVGAFPGKPDFRGLGELNVNELKSLFPARQPVSSDELDLASFAWRAYCSADPTAIERLLTNDTTPLPFLSTALRAHLQRFPSLENGLGRIEKKGLELIDHGVRSFTDLFPRFGESEPVYGLGDSQFWINIKQLSDVSEPLVSMNSEDQGVQHSAARSVQLEITDTGRAVLRQEADFVRLNGIDNWFGGVHLLGRDGIWRWDTRAERLTTG